MDYKDKNSREIWLEIKLAGFEKKNTTRDYYAKMTVDLFVKMIEEYQSGKTPRYVQEIVTQFSEKRRITGYQWCMLDAAYNLLIKKEDFKNIELYLKKEAVLYLYRLGYVDEQSVHSFRNMYHALEEKKSHFLNEKTKQSTGQKGFSFGRSSSEREVMKLEERKQQLLNDIKSLEESKSRSADRAQELQAEVISFEEQKKNIRDEVNVLMRQELERARKSLDEEMNRARNEKVFALEEELRVAYETKKTEVLEKLESDTLYEARKKELEKLMDSSEVLYKQQEEKKAEVLEQMTQMKLQFKAYHDIMERQLQEMQEKIHSEYVGAINKVVMVEREMQQEKVEALIENCAELQRTCYYQRDEKELGLAPSRVESYLNRFMRELKKCGFEAEMPEIGEAFDYEKHEIRESKNDEIEEYYGS